jgi:hypothetical protein
VHPWRALHILQKSAPLEGSAEATTPLKGSVAKGVPRWGSTPVHPWLGSARTVHEACHGRECLVCHFGSRILVTGFRPAVAGLSQAWGFSPQAGGGNPLRATGRRAREVPSSSRKARTLDFPDRGSSGVGGGSALRSVPSVRTVHEACHGRECLVCHFGSRILVTGFRPAVAWGGEQLLTASRRGVQRPSFNSQAP